MAQQPISRDVSQDLTLQCLDTRGRPVELVASFGYDPSDPYAVWLTFRAKSGDVRWAVSRALLLRGLADPAGEGDIRLWPSIDQDARAVVVMDFRSPGGRLVAQVNSQDLHAFLNRTQAAVPLGTERGHLDLDELVCSLLDSEPGED